MKFIAVRSASGSSLIYCALSPPVTVSPTQVHLQCGGAVATSMKRITPSSNASEVSRSRCIPSSPSLNVAPSSPARSLWRVVAQIDPAFRRQKKPGPLCKPLLISEQKLAYACGWGRLPRGNPGRKRVEAWKAKAVYPSREGAGVGIASRVSGGRDNFIHYSGLLGVEPA